MNARGEHGNTALHHAVLVRQSIKISFLQHLILPSNIYVFFFFSFFSFAIVFWVRKKQHMQEQLNTKCLRVLTCCDVALPQCQCMLSGRNQSGYVLVVIHVLTSIFVSFASRVGVRTCCVCALYCVVRPAMTTMATVDGHYSVYPTTHQYQC